MVIFALGCLAGGAVAVVACIVVLALSWNR